VRIENSTPFGVHYDRVSHMSIIFDRLYRPLVRATGRWPRCDLAAAVPANPEPRLYGKPKPSFFYRSDDQNAPRCCPLVRRRLADLMGRCPVLREEIERRREAEATKSPPPLSHDELIAQIFRKRVSA
jgi:hypothetical protein